MANVNAGEHFPGELLHFRWSVRAVVQLLELVPEYKNVEKEKLWSSLLEWTYLPNLAFTPLT